MSIRLGDGTLIAGGAQTIPLLSTMWADHILNDVSWLRADTFSWQSGDVYKSVYEKLVSEYATGTTETERAITFKRTESGFKIAESTQEQAIIDLYNSTGIAWYYILDTTNKRFKLPRTKYNFTGLRDSVGSYVEESLPNITGSLNIRNSTADSGLGTQASASGAFKLTQTGTGKKTFGESGSTYAVSQPDFNASRSSSAYKNGAPVQQRATQMYLYFFVGNYVQNQTAIDIGQMSEQLNGKADVGLANLTASGKELISGFGMPSDRYDNLSTSTNVTYTAPADGWFYLYGITAATNCDAYLYRGGTGINRMNSIRVAATTIYGPDKIIGIAYPAKKGEVVGLEWTNVTFTDRDYNNLGLRFYYLEGNKS